MSDQQQDLTLASWQERQEYAEMMQPLIGRLYRNYGVEILVYGRSLLNVDTINIIKAHRLISRHEGLKLRLRESYPFIEALSKMKLAPARVDLGKLAFNYLHKDAGKGDSIEAYLERELAEIVNHADEIPVQDIVLYGFGRIGRLLARLLIERNGSNNKMRLRAIVVGGGGEGDLEKRASLLSRDSIHGPYNGSITVDHESSAIKANGTSVKVIYSDGPDQVDYTQYGINNAIVIDNTGIWKDEVGLGLHLKSKGVKKVLLTAPSKGDIKNIVYGVNHNDIQPEDLIVSAASCSTNAITPVLKVVNDEFGIRNGHVETVHSYTNDQNLIDNYHKADRRGRSAPLIMVLTETGAAKAVAKALPELAGKLTGNAIRVPIPNVSMAILNLTLGSETDAEALNDYLRHMSLDSPFQKQIDYVDSPEVVSSDFVGNRHAGIVDAKATIASGKQVVLYVWYDNEFGYSCQVVRMLQHISNVNFLKLPRAQA